MEYFRIQRHVFMQKSDIKNLRVLCVSVANFNLKPPRRRGTETVSMSINGKKFSILASLSHPSRDHGAY
ncbi:Uncharacterised protein [uncultured archaeon]|nr:Uncharacterised protein [uncultured archaeon]